MNAHFCDICKKRLSVWNRALGLDRCRRCQQQYPYRHSHREVDLLRSDLADRDFCPLRLCLPQVALLSVIYLGAILLGQFVGGIVWAIGFSVLALLLMQAWRVINPQHVLNAARLRHYFAGLVASFWVSLALSWVLAGCAIDSCGPAVVAVLPRVLPLPLWWLPALIGVLGGLLVMAVRDADLRREVADMLRLAPRNWKGSK